MADKKYGFIDKDGEIRIDPRFTTVRPFSEGVAAVEIDDKWGYIDQTGTFAINPQFQFAYSFNGGFAVVRMIEPFDWYYIDKAGNFAEGPNKNWRKLKKPTSTQQN